MSSKQQKSKESINETVTGYSNLSTKSEVINRRKKAIFENNKIYILCALSITLLSLIAYIVLGYTNYSTPAILLVLPILLIPSILILYKKVKRQEQRIFQATSEYVNKIHKK